MNYISLHYWLHFITLLITSLFCPSQITGLRNSHKCTAKWRPRPVCASSKRQQLVLKQMKILSLSEEIAIATSYSFYRYKNKQLIIFWSDCCFTKVCAQSLWRRPVCPTDKSRHLLHQLKILFWSQCQICVEFMCKVVFCP